ncbi:unnamed protein product [Bursaphelenchus okinawaensis]|uniref:Uncharacterized protein n=1 Tax=Bursaphelenchus okinawaensis TaxID=465554 RepID=A0A811KUK4_9BILA|nr:unnamed protein product [Bursaphelenchus okinawaensis]CAG9113503.1 unnamed protein product [Bursaphelenchus okinawaensis]
MGICFSVFRCGKCQHTKFFNCKCKPDKCLLDAEAARNRSSGLSSTDSNVVEPAREELVIVDEIFVPVESSEENANVQKENEVFEFGKADGEEHDFSFTMNTGEENSTSPTLDDVETGVENNSMANLDQSKFSSSDKRRFKNKVRRNVVMDEKFQFHLTPTPSMTQVQSKESKRQKSSMSMSEAKSERVQHPSRSISGELCFNSSRKSQTPQSSISSPVESTKSTPKSMYDRLNQSLSPSKKSQEPLGNRENFPAIFHPSVMEKKDGAGDEVFSDDDKENCQSSSPRTPTSDPEDEDVEDEQIRMAGNEPNHPKIKRRRKNKQNRMRKKARRH